MAEISDFWPSIGTSGAGFLGVDEHARAQDATRRNAAGRERTIGPPISLIFSHPRFREAIRPTPAWAARRNPEARSCPEAPGAGVGRPAPRAAPREGPPGWGRAARDIARRAASGRGRGSETHQSVG